MIHQHPVALAGNEVACRFPHHSGTTPWISEGFKERLGPHSVIGLLVETERALEAIEYRASKAEALDALRRPICRNFVAGHAPHLFGVGLEEDREELLAELVDGPVLERFHVLAGRKTRLGIGR